MIRQQIPNKEYLISVQKIEEDVFDSHPFSCKFVSLNFMLRIDSRKLKHALKFL